MAIIHIPADARRISDPTEVAAYLSEMGLPFERWPLAERVDPDAGPEAILAAYAPEIERLKQRGGYVAADVISVTPDTPGLDAMLARFNKEHRHAEDEVRFILKGSGLFHIHLDSRPVISITVTAGDLLTVPRGTRHWFDLCTDRTVRAIRLFKDPAGWQPTYVADGVHDAFEPVCWGPRDLAPQTLQDRLEIA